MRFALSGERFHLVQVGTPFQRAAEGRTEPARERLGHAGDERRHRRPPERSLRLLIIGLRVVARNAEQRHRGAMLRIDGGTPSASAISRAAARYSSSTF
jgi:hypothetical protein